MLPSPIDLAGVSARLGGYYNLAGELAHAAPDVTTDAYALDQEQVNARKTLDYLLPRIRACQAHTVLDVGCGVGAMVRTLLNEGLDAYGVDLPGLHRHWTRLGLPEQQMFIVSPDALRLPFTAGSIDFVYTVGVIEHVGTSNGHSDRLPDYHALRKAWLRELWRVVRPGGAMLIGGPNRGFPVDVAHDLDSRASGLERWLSRRLKVSVHKTWGENFLWGYDDVASYLAGTEHVLEPQSIDGLLAFGRVPAPLRALASRYIRHLPRALRGTGWNPWVMALVHKPR